MYHCRRLSKENWRAFHLKKPIIIRIPNEVIVISSLKQQGIWISRKDNPKIRNVYNQLFLLIESLQKGPVSRLDFQAQSVNIIRICSKPPKSHWSLPRKFPSVSSEAWLAAPAPLSIFHLCLACRFAALCNEYAAHQKLWCCERSLRPCF